MPEGYKIKEEIEEEQKREEEKRRKQQMKKEEKSAETTQKKEAIEKGQSEEQLKFGEARSLIETKYEKVPLKESAGSKYEPIIKEELAVRLKEEEKIRKEEEKKRMNEKEKFQKQQIKEIQERERKRREEIERLSKEIGKILDEEKKKGIGKDIRGRVIARLKIMGVLRKRYTSQIKKILDKLIPKMAG